MVRFAHASPQAGSVWDKTSPKSSLSKVKQKSFPQAYGGSLEVNDECFLGGSL